MTRPSGGARGAPRRQWVGGALVACLVACVPGGPELEPPATERLLAPTVLRGVVVDGYRAAEREFQVRAARAEVETAHKVVRLRDVRIAFEEASRGSVEVRAERARLQLDRDDFVLRGDVVGQTGEGERFTTDELHYDAARHRLWTDRPVRVERSNLVLTGTGMEFDVAARRIRFSGHVEARIVER